MHAWHLGLAATNSRVYSVFIIFSRPGLSEWNERFNSIYLFFVVRTSFDDVVAHRWCTSRLAEFKPNIRYICNALQTTIMTHETDGSIYISPVNSHKHTCIHLKKKERIEFWWSNLPEPESSGECWMRPLTISQPAKVAQNSWEPPRRRHPPYADMLEPFQEQHQGRRHARW